MGMLPLMFIAPTSSSLDAILSDRKLDGAMVAAVVTDLDGKVLYARNTGQHVLPASNMKLFSNAFALHQLGPDWRPQTRFWKEPGRTVVESTGDALLTYSQLVDVRSKLALDTALPVYVHEEFAPLWRENWEYGDLPNKFAAPVCAFTVDRGSFSIWARRRRPQFQPDAYGTRVMAASLPPGAKTAYDPFRRVLLASPDAFAKDGLVDTLSLPRPDEAAASLLGSRMVSTDDVPARAPDLVLDGRPIADIVRACLPPSDNQLAEQLLFLGARSEGPLGPAAYNTARVRLANFLTRIAGVEPGDIHVDDGSGLSRHNFVTVRALAQLLAWADRQPTAEMWRGALAHPGTNANPGAGTLARRLTGLNFAGKTGSLEMVAALSGYLETAKHHPLIVSIVVNEFGCPESETRAIMDRFVRAVAETNSF